MFVLVCAFWSTHQDNHSPPQTTISDVIQISPSDFNKPSAHALEDNIHKKYANKVVQNVGLCISFWDFLKVSDGQIIGGNPNVQVNGN